MEYMGSFRITENGQAMFGLVRGGAYLVTVTEEKSDEPIVMTAGRFYTVVKGDTLSAIAAKYRLPLARLVALNPEIRDINKLKIGQRIRLK